MTDVTRLNEYILDLLVPNLARDTIGIVASLDGQDWDYFLKRGREHRFLPLLNWSLGQSAALAQVPKTVRNTLAETHRRQTKRALEIQRELLLVHRLLAKADIEHVFLKGAFLAQFAYPHPALRPVRDLDVVVRPEDAIRAQRALVDAGYAPLIDAPGMVSAYLDQAKHLPGLVSPSRRVLVELHVHVDHPGGVLAGLDAFRKITTRDLAGETLPFMDPTDLVVHLCVHAATFHAFNNGPLIVADIGFLLQSGGLAPERVMSRAAELGVTKPVALTLALTETCWGRKRNDLPMLSDPVPTEMLAISRQLCLRSFDERANVSLFVSLTAPKTKAEAALVLMKKVLPSSSYLALQFGQPRSGIELSMFHVKRWQSFISQRLPALVRGRKQSSFNVEVENVMLLQSWLET